jgi:serine protease AprX
MSRSAIAVHQGDEPQGTSWSFGTSWSITGLPGRVLTLLVAVVVAGGLMAPPQQQQAAAAAADRMVENASEVVEVIVRAVTGSSEAEQSVQRLGGTVVQRLGIVDGYVVRISADKVAELSTSPGILSVTANSPVRLMSRRSEGADIQGAATLTHVRRVTGSTVSDRRGFDGTGIGVAIVDTGVAGVTGLPKLFTGPNVGGGSMADGYGHGTHLGGIIAGNDGIGSEGFLGVASEADLVAVKAANDSGATNLGAVLAALEWVVANKTDRNIRVLELALGVPAPADYRTDLLSIAVERVWQAGIVVVVAAGNSGEQPGSPLTSPATDPFVIAVGSVDTKDTENLSDDVVQSFSPRGSAARRVDLVAPGQSLVSLRAPGSVAETSYPAAHVGSRFIKGTGTSQASAVVAGLAADLIEQRPTLTPDEVKAILIASASPLSNADAAGQGGGLVNLKKALATLTPTGVTQLWEPAGNITLSGDPVLPIFAVPPPAEGMEYCEYDVNAGPPAPPAPDGSSGTCGWVGGSWTDVTYDEAGNFTGGSWTGGSWTGGSWTGGSWTGGSWTGGSWTGGSWTGGSWTGGSWTGGSWTGGSWTDALKGGTWS